MSVAGSVYSASPSYGRPSSPGSVIGTSSTFSGYKSGRRGSVEMSTAARLHKYIRRIFRRDQMDFEFALWQAVYLIINPQVVYRNFHYRKQTKNQYARDDPAFLVLVSVFLSFTSVCFGLVMGVGPGDIIELILWVTFVDFIFFGMIVASSMWFLCNKYLALNNKSDLEWAYCFDIHINAFFAVFIILHMAQLLVIKLVLQPMYFSTLIGNAFWLIAAGYYCYITFLGYSTQPNLKKSVVFLYPLVPCALLFVLAFLFNWNWTQSLVTFYRTRL